MICGYTFQDKELLQQALTHPSCSKENNYERLEFLGDKIVGMVIAEYLFRRFQDKTEGDLSVMHANLVNSKIMTLIAQSIDLESHLKICDKEYAINKKSGKRNLPNALEAFLGALYIDSSYSNVSKFILNLWKQFFSDPNILNKDPKSALQEIIQSVQKGQTPIYSIVSKDGADHSPFFCVEVNAEGIGSAKGYGDSKKSAEQDAASSMLKILETYHLNNQ